MFRLKPEAILPDWWINNIAGKQSRNINEIKNPMKYLKPELHFGGLKDGMKNRGGKKAQELSVVRKDLMEKKKPSNVPIQQQKK